MAEQAIPDLGDRKLRILCVGLGWASTTGGHTVTRELSIGLAEVGHDVRVWLPEQMPDPQIPNLRIHYPTDPGERPDPAQSANDQLETQRRMLLTPDGLPDGIDLVIGHARFTGDLALDIRDRFCPDAKAVYVMHMSPEEGSRARHGDGVHADRKALEDVERMKRADLVVGVGPLITEESRRLLRRNRSAVPVHEMIPGIVAQDPPLYYEPQRRFEILLTGRMDDKLKGGPEAAAMITELRRRGIPAHLVVRGVPPQDLAADQLRMNKETGNAVRLRPFTNDPEELRRDLNGADVFIMPSHHEGFGLVATEAAGAGVPILVNEQNTGVGMFLADADRVPPELGKGSTVMASPHDVTGWADRIQATLENLPDERARALELRKLLTTKFTWRASGEELAAAVNQLPPPQSAISPEMRTAMKAGLTPAAADKGVVQKSAGERTTPASTRQHPGATHER
jgi:glycosyltransferase involved in cell wall biosynthesis